MACANTFHAAALRDPCGAQMRVTAPEQFSIVFGTNYGGFTARCRRAHAPAWVDRVFNLALNGYYDDSYFPRVVESERLSIIQFGTNGVPSVSNVYNYSTSTSPCAVIEPQPPQMLRDVGGATPLSNTFGTIAMSTSFNEATGTTWNATAELFVNTPNNSWLDDKLFMPICTVDDDAAAAAAVTAAPAHAHDSVAWRGATAALSCPRANIRHTLCALHHAAALRPRLVRPAHRDAHDPRLPELR
eukprot:3030864-Prymnesium_polylepis.1